MGNLGTHADAAVVTDTEGTISSYLRGLVTLAAAETAAEAAPDTGTSTSVSSSATNVTLKAANASRRGLTVHNDSTAILYLKLGATASATSYTVEMAAGDYFEVPFGYTGIIDGIWASANGNARITELT